MSEAHHFKPYIRYEGDELTPDAQEVGARIDEKSVLGERNNDELQDPSRRDFLMKAGAVATVIGAGGVLVKEVLERERTPIDEASSAVVERVPVLLTPLQQLEQLGKIQNLESGIQQVYADHYAYLVQTEKGQSDMDAAIVNLSKVDMRALTTPFKKRNLPQHYAYMIAIQETRGQVVTSHAGARGMMGIMPSMAVAYGIRSIGYKDEASFRTSKLNAKKRVELEKQWIDAVENPYYAAEVAAWVLDEERKRFGNNELMFHAYNGGGGQLGFTAKSKKEERTPKNFYRFVEEHMNERYAEALRDGYFVHTVKMGKRDRTLHDLAKDYGVRFEDLLKVNGLSEGREIVLKEKIKIPFDNSTSIIKRFFRKEFEILLYAPEMRAKFDSLKTRGLIAKLENTLEEKTHSFG